MTNKQDLTRNAFMLTGSFAEEGYDWWWHSFTGRHERTGEEKAFFVEFFTCNPARGGAEPVLGQLSQNKEKGIKPSYLMIKAGCWGENAVQLHRFFGWDDVKISKGTPYSVEAGDCFASDLKLKGEVNISKEEAAEHPEYMCGSGSMKFDLTVDKQIAFNVGYGASKPLRDAKAFEMYWHAEGIKTLYSGTVEFNGEKYLVTPETSFGYADKNWGRGFTTPWVWLSSCNLKSLVTGKTLHNSAFDIGGGRPKIYHLALDRKLLGTITYEGKDYEFNFSKFWTLSRTKFDCRETETEIIWHVDQETVSSRLVTDITCEKRDMLLVNYEAPDGTKRHNHLWNGGTGKGELALYRRTKNEWELIDRIEAKNVGCEYGEYDK